MSFTPFSQDDNFVDSVGGGGGGPSGLERGGEPGGVGAEDEDQCFMCNMKKQSDWIQCDQCDKWFHIICVGLTPDTIPDQNDKYYCPNCRELSNSNMKLGRGFSEFGNNILE